MKIKYVSAVAAILLCSAFLCGNTFAQTKPETKIVLGNGPKQASDYKYEFRLGWGGFPVVDMVSIYGVFGKAIYDIGMRQYNLNYIYSDYDGPGYLTGTLSAEFDVNFKKWFTLTIGVGVCGAYQDVYDSVSNLKSGRNYGASVSLLPEARFNWLNRDIVRMYSAVGVGLTCSVFNQQDSWGYTDVLLYPAAQLTPVGISLGRKVYGFAELGIGTQFIGAMAGVGVRF